MLHKNIYTLMHEIFFNIIISTNNNIKLLRYICIISEIEDIIKEQYRIHILINKYFFLKI